METELLSFIIPCYGSEETVGLVIDEIKDIVSVKSDYDYEIICVNDCSPDNVWKVLTAKADEDHKIKLINFAKNFNRPGAVLAGLSYSRGSIAIIMDDDSQCPMPELWNLIQPLYEGYDVSMARYPDRKQSIFKDFGTFVNSKMTEFVIDRPKDLMFTNFMALKRFVVDEIVTYDNPYPYLTGLLLRTTRQIANVPMEERARIKGTTTFTIKKMIMLWLNGFTAFSVKPLRISFLFGSISAVIGFICALYIIIRKILDPDIAAGWSSIISINLIIGGLILLSLGLIGEYVGRIYMCVNNQPQYVIKETVNLDEKKTVQK